LYQAQISRCTFFWLALTPTVSALDLRNLSSRNKFTRLEAAMKSRATYVAAVIAFLLIMTLASQAQWVAVARAVSGRIQQMQQKNANGPGGYDVATVVIEAPAQKVYETAIQRLQAHSAQVKVIEQNDKKREVAFTNGTQTASLQANSLGDKLTQLVVASTLDPAGQSATSFVVRSIQNVCTELKVECTLEND